MVYRQCIGCCLGGLVDIHRFEVMAFPLCFSSGSARRSLRAASGILGASAGNVAFGRCLYESLAGDFNVATLVGTQDPPSGWSFSVAVSAISPPSTGGRCLQMYHRQCISPVLLLLRLRSMHCLIFPVLHAHHLGVIWHFTVLSTPSWRMTS